MTIMTGYIYDADDERVQSQEVQIRVNKLIT